jgi:hypothetical protein
MLRHCDEPMSRHCDKSMPRQGDKSMLRLCDEPMPRQGQKPLPRQSEMCMPWQKEKMGLSALEKFKEPGIRGCLGGVDPLQNYCRGTRLELGRDSPFLDRR